MAQKRLISELQSLQKEKWLYLDVDEANIFKWKIGLMVVNPDSVWNGAYLKAEMRFTDQYPYSPPAFRFTDTNIYHPNIYPDGNLCISILHPPGEDEKSGEQACERWSPLQGVESVLRSVLLLLDSPETGSPANVDAGIMYRNKREKYDNKARETVKQSKSNIPGGVRMPTADDLVVKEPQVLDDDAFWNESGDDDFGSDSDDFDDDED